MARSPAWLFPLYRDSFVLYLKCIYLPDNLTFWKIRCGTFRLAQPVNKSMPPKELGRVREGYTPGISWLWGPTHRQPRHPPGRPAADSISPPFLPGSTARCLCCCSLSSTCISRGGEGISQSYVVCWEYRWSRCPYFQEVSNNWKPLLDQSCSPPLWPHSLWSEGASDNGGVMTGLC